MVDLDIEMGNDLSAKTRELAVRYFGDDGDASLAQVLEVAIRMRCLWSHLVKAGQLETDEAISNWEFTEGPVTEENDDTIRQWLFRR
jgi:hypothetical protein